MKKIYLFTILCALCVSVGYAQKTDMKVQRTVTNTETGVSTDIQSVTSVNGQATVKTPLVPGLIWEATDGASILSLADLP